MTLVEILFSKYVASWARKRARERDGTGHVESSHMVGY